MKEKEYKLNIDPRILELLGPSLYTNIYYVLAELIANAYDADAHNVYIIANKDDITVEDDGKGMSYADGDIQKYLNVAAVSRNTDAESLTPMKRKKMGRKGVGKLAALSVSVGPMVCSMRPMTPENAKKAYDITVKMPNVHGAPVHMGDAAEVGVADVMKPDYGEAVDFYEGEIPVFWPCGVTPQAAVENAKPPIAITHAPGHMFITDIINSELNDYLEAKKNR